ncbi:MAG: hypothetical protein LAP21_22715 [Acidobacteriia bacterium]|nr:hypothetical protein [Terriglobia bacterium]
MAFEQAQIDVQKTAEFEQLKAAIERVFAAAAVEGFLKKLQSSDARIRQFEKVLEAQVIESVDATLKKSGKTARQLYATLTVSDQAMMREFYLERIEQAAPALREKYRKVYRYY